MRLKYVSQWGSPEKIIAHLNRLHIRFHLNKQKTNGHSIRMMLLKQIELLQYKFGTFFQEDDDGKKSFHLFLDQVEKKKLLFFYGNPRPIEIGLIVVFHSLFLVGLNKQFKEFNFIEKKKIYKEYYNELTYFDFRRILTLHLIQYNKIQFK